jgi:hypothetical protein
MNIPPMLEYECFKMSSQGHLIIASNKSLTGSDVSVPCEEGMSVLFVGNED